MRRVPWVPTGTLRGVARPKARRRDPMEGALEAAFQPRRFIAYGDVSTFISGLEKLANQVADQIRIEPARAVDLYETFLAGCYEKADEIDDSDGAFGVFVEGLVCGWAKARQAADADRVQTAALLLARIDDDPYGFCHDIERELVKVLDKAGLAALAQVVEARLEAAANPGTGADEQTVPHAQDQWGRILRAVYAQGSDLSAYIGLCERTRLLAEDCHAVALMLVKRRKPGEALVWAERGLTLDKDSPHRSTAAPDLARLRRTLLVKLGRSGEALEEAWTQFHEHPNTFTYGEFMRLVPKADRATWHAKAMAASETRDLGSLVADRLETGEIDRLVARLRAATDREIESQSHYTTEPAAKRIEKAHPAVAAKVYRALGMRIVNAAKSKYYDAALLDFERAKRCYRRAGLTEAWDRTVADIRRDHSRKTGFIPGFERLVAGHGPSDEPSFLERARKRWAPRGES